jgi:hypothetical protein
MKGKASPMKSKSKPTPASDRPAVPSIGEYRPFFSTEQEEESDPDSESPFTSTDNAFSSPVKRTCVDDDDSAMPATEH